MTWYLCMYYQQKKSPHGIVMRYVGSIRISPSLIDSSVKVIDGNRRIWSNDRWKQMIGTSFLNSGCRYCRVKVPTHLFRCFPSTCMDVAFRTATFPLPTLYTYVYLTLYVRYNVPKGSPTPLYICHHQYHISIILLLIQWTTRPEYMMILTSLVPRYYHR